MHQKTISAIEANKTLLVRIITTRKMMVAHIRRRRIAGVRLVMRVIIYNQGAIASRNEKIRY
jgi:hypothetical protein